MNIDYAYKSFYGKKSYPVRAPTSIVFEHDIHKVDYFDFIIKNTQVLTSKPYFSEFFVRVHSSNEAHTIEDINFSFEKLAEAMQYFCGIKIKRINNKPEQEAICRSIFEQSRKVLILNSDMIISLYYAMNYHLFSETEDNIAVPIMHYKYCYKNITYKWSYLFNEKPKEFRVKYFIKSDAPFYQYGGSNEFIPDWDERFYINHTIYNKMDGSLPISCPSPLLHNWGTYIQLLHSGAEQSRGMASSKFAVHRFERVPEE